MPTFQGHIYSKLPKVGTTVFSVMSALAQQHKAINLSQGFPDFPTDPSITTLVNKYMQKGYNQYAPMQGIIELREAIANKLHAMYACSYDPDKEVTITAGATQAIFSAISAIIKEGDEAILFTPAYDCYSPSIELNGGKPIHVQLRYPDYRIDWTEVKKVMNRKTRLIIINTPHNPTGAIMSAQDMEYLEKLTNGTDIVVLSDEVYEHIIFDDYEHQSVARFPKLAERSLLVYSFGKTFHGTGWKMGYCVGPTELMKEFRKAHQFVVFACNHPMQRALAEYLSDETHYNSIHKMYEHKRNFFNDRLKGSKFIFHPSAGTYFQLLNYSNISDETDTDFAIRLTKEYKIAAIPVSGFYHNPVDDKVLRFCFAKEEDTLEKAAEILTKITQ